MTTVADNMTIVARQAVRAMVAGHVEVSVDADCLLMANHNHGARSGSSIGGVVSVELIGPDDKTYGVNRMVSARGEAGAWGIDEIVSAARRAAERILHSNPTWRRVLV